MAIRIGVTPLPADVVNIARRVMQSAMELDEDANNCAGHPDPGNFDRMLESMLTMKETLIQAFSEIQVG